MYFQGHLAQRLPAIATITTDPAATIADPTAFNTAAAADLTDTTLHGYTAGWQQPHVRSAERVGEVRY